MDEKKSILTLIAQASAIEVNNDLKKKRKENEDLSLKEKDAAITAAWLTWQPYLKKNKERAK